MPDEEAFEIARSRLGHVLRGKYRLHRVLGVGGMAAVYFATHRNRKTFAIKMLHPDLSLRETIRARFLREGYVANSVGHPGAVAVLDDDVAEDGSAFLVMELLEGVAVDELWSQQGRRLPLALAVSIGDALLEVLVAAHARGIVHRDLKPANLFLTDDGVLKVLDFGIARLRDHTSQGATATGAMLGTPAFMSPEQALAISHEIDARSDLWAVGATLFSLVSGKIVHEGENASQLFVAAATKPARSIGSVASDIPAPVAKVLDRALAFEKKDRWESASAMRDALAKAWVEATGGPVGPLPKREKQSAAIEDTVDASGAPPTPNTSDAPPGETGDARKTGGTTAKPVTGGAASAVESVGRERRRRAWLVAGLLATVATATVATIRFAGVGGRPVGDPEAQARAVPTPAEAPAASGSAASQASVAVPLSVAATTPAIVPSQAPGASAHSRRPAASAPSTSTRAVADASGPPAPPTASQPPDLTRELLPSPPRPDLSPRP